MPAPDMCAGLFWYALLPTTPRPHSPLSARNSVRRFRRWTHAPILTAFPGGPLGFADVTDGHRAPLLRLSLKDPPLAH